MRFLPVALAGLAALVAACGERDEAAAPPVGGDSWPAPGSRLLGLDGIDFTVDEVRPYVAFYDAIYPQWSLRAKIRKVLTSHLIPLRLAQRRFGAERQQQLARARELLAVAGNAHELAQRSELLHHRRERVGLQQVELPIAMFLFDRSRLGAVSEPIELPQGWMLCGALDLEEGAVVGDDLVDAIQVPFATHDHPAFAAWLDQERQAVAGKATYVHPDFHAAMPPWLQLP